MDTARRRHLKSQAKYSILHQQKERAFKLK